MLLRLLPPLPTIHLQMQQEQSRLIRSSYRIQVETAEAVELAEVNNAADNAPVALWAEASKVSLIVAVAHNLSESACSALILL
jgi:hypothetical protein